MKRWRLLDTPPMTAAENMALDDTLLELKGKGKTPDTIRFLQFSPRAVLVGFHQSVQEEIRSDYCRAQGIEINRRITGGGAIFFDENQLGWEIICEKTFFNMLIPNNRLFRTLCNPVIDALQTMGLQADFRPRNDIEINGRKISGTGGTESDLAFMFQGTMLVNFDVDTMLRALRIPIEKLKAKEIDSVRERVTCLNWELGHTPDTEDIKDALQSGFEKNFQIKLEKGGLTQAETHLFKQKVDYYKSREWIDSVKPKFQKREAIQAAYKSPGGMIRFTLVVNLPQKRIKDVYITGDFLAFPNRSLYDLEVELRGAPLDQKFLHACIKNHFDSRKMTIPGLKFEDFIKPLDQALEKIAIAKRGLSLEQCNLISVTNGTFESVLAQKPSALLLPYCAKMTGCDLRYQKTCRNCGDEECSIGPAWTLGGERRMEIVSIVSFEDLWQELMRLKAAGVSAFIGCCCQPFFTKHLDDFERAGLPGILLDIDNSTCYDLDQAQQAYDGTFESQTCLNLDLLEAVLRAQHDTDGPDTGRHEPN